MTIHWLSISLWNKQLNQPTDTVIPKAMLLTILLMNRLLERNVSSGDLDSYPLCDGKYLTRSCQ